MSIDSLVASEPVRLTREALADRDDVWLVGGAIRDALLDRPLLDLDLAVTGGEEQVARTLARAAGGHGFALSEQFATWRVVFRHHPWRIDVGRARGQRIEDDLAARDLTVNAMAMPLGGGELLDPHSGRADLDAKLLRAVGEQSFADDPLRMLRTARIGSELGFSVDPQTVALARAQAPRAAEPAGERQLAELRGILAGPDPLMGLALMDELAVTPSVLPELEALRGVEQNPYHHADAHGHTIDVLARMIDVERDLEALFGEHAPALRALLQEPLADELSRAGALRFAALFHDLGKPETRAVNEAGRVMFLGHDRVGARIIGSICTRLRTSRRLRNYLESLTLHHLHLGFLVHARPLTRRHVYDYLTATEPESVDVTLLTVADRLATQGPKTRKEAIDAHVELAGEMIGEALAWRRDGPPKSPIPGDELAAELGIEPDERLGRLLGEIAAAVFSGQVSSREQAIELARSLL